MSRILTTLDHLKRLPWGPSVDFIDPEPLSVPALFRHLLRRASDYDLVILNGSGRRDQLAAALLRRLRPRMRLLLTDCTWKLEASRGARALTRIGIRLMDGPRTHYCVLSSAEKNHFPDTWGVDPERVFLTHWYVWLSDQEAQTPVSEQGFVFSGGDSMRDYRPLIEAARSLPAAVRIATHLPAPVVDSELPSNMDFAPLPVEDYFETMCRASVVVLCLGIDSERSAGQNNYLNPMAMGKLVVINDTTGVCDYVEDRATALVVPSADPAALAGALRWALDPDNAGEVHEIAERARRDVNDRFPPERYVARLLEVAETVSGPAA